MLVMGMGGAMAMVEACNAWVLAGLMGKIVDVGRGDWHAVNNAAMAAKLPN